uniref:Stimulated by retinoic acid 8 n=1 Tax=Podarcis muralis TaxID=64176 RepID=A0A670J0M2_PODMU
MQTYKFATLSTVFNNWASVLGKVSSLFFKQWNGIVLQLLMETSGNCSTPYARVTSKYRTRLQDPKSQGGKRRLSQARNRATLAGLFNNLRETVYSQQDNSTSKVLNLEDGHPSSLEEVKEEYVKMYFNNHRYLHFYKQTVDLLVDNGVVSPEDVTLPVVSTAVSHLWQGLPEERRDGVLQYCNQRQNFITEVKMASQEPPCTEGSVRDSGASQEASGSLVSTPEEVRNVKTIPKQAINNFRQMALSPKKDQSSKSLWVFY